MKLKSIEDIEGLKPKQKVFKVQYGKSQINSYYFIGRHPLHHEIAVLNDSCSVDERSVDY